MKFHVSKFTLKLNVPWNFTHDTCRIVEFRLGESRVAFRIVQFRLHEGSYRVKCVSRSTRLVCGTSVFSAKPGRMNEYHDLDTPRINDVSPNLIFHASEKVRIGTNTGPATRCTRRVFESRYLSVCPYFRKIRVRII